MSKVISDANEIGKLADTNAMDYDSWHVSCHYNSDEMSMGFMECAALFYLEVQLGWDAYFRPVCERQVD